MPQTPQVTDYEPVNRPAVAAGFGTVRADDWPHRDWPRSDSGQAELKNIPTDEPDSHEQVPPGRKQADSRQRGHLLSFVGLFLFTFIVYVRPYEVVSSLSWLSGGAFWIALATIIVFMPTQFMLAGKLTARPREVDLLLLLVLFAL